MQGYILNITPQKNEDIILSVLTPAKIKKLYRFYGARHSIIQLGKKIDFEREMSGNFLPRLRNVTGLNFFWERERERVSIWQHTLQLLHRHFHDVVDVDGFYYQNLEYAAAKMELQNPMRVVVEMYAMLLDFEGRMPKMGHCFLCEKELLGHIALARAFLPAHPSCLQSAQSFEKEAIEQFLAQKSTLSLEDREVQGLWNVLTLGM